MKGVNRHYRYISRVVDKPGPISDTVLEAPIVVIPTDRWNLVTYNAVRFGLTLSKEVIVVHIKSEEKDSSIQTEWKSHIEIPARKMKLPVPKMVVVNSPYRFVITPILDYVARLELEHPNRQIAVIIPTLVEKYCTTVFFISGALNYSHPDCYRMVNSGLLLAFHGT